MHPPRFIFRKDSRHPDRPGALLCRITLDKENREFTTPVKVLRKDWDATGQRVRGLSKDARLANTVLSDIASDINRLYYDLERAKEYITAERLLRAYQTGQGPRVTFVMAWAEFVARRYPLIGVSISASKFWQEGHRCKLLTAFLQGAGKLDLLPGEFTAKIADAFLLWLRTVRKNGQNYSAKVMQTVKQVLRWCVRQGYASVDPLAAYALRFAAPKLPLFLSNEELDRLIAHPFAAAPLRAAADCFLFQCYTGLAYADLRNFRRTEHVGIGPDGRYWLRMQRQKTLDSTGQVATVRLPGAALALLDKYGNALPVVSNQVYNRYLKEIAALLGFDNLRLTSHVGRKTAGALLLQDGMSLAAVSKVLGHASVLMTQKHYVSITDNVVASEFARVYDSVAGKGFEPGAGSHLVTR